VWFFGNQVQCIVFFIFANFFILMDELYEILKDNSTENYFEVEKKLPKYKYLENLFNNMWNKDFYLLLITVSCSALYNFSKKEEYWQMLSEEVRNFNFNKIQDIYLFFIDFLPKIEKDRKKIPNKVSKIKDLKPLLDDMFFKQKYYYKNMGLLKNKISERIKKLKLVYNDNIAIYVVRNYSFWSKIRFNQDILFPIEFPIVIDESLKNIFKLYNNEEYKDIKIFYMELASRLSIPEYHLWILLKNKYKV